jgi:hypothetical protein
MGRIRHTTLAYGLLDDGYWLRAVAFSSEGPIAKTDCTQLTWRELAQLLEDLTDSWRPGVELMTGGTQETLFV